MVIKTWIQNFSRGMKAITAPEIRAKERERRFRSLLRWKVHWVVALLPILVQLSLAVFASGLFLYLQPLHTPSAYVVLGVSSLALLFYLFVHSIYLSDEFSSFSLPLTREYLRFLHWEKAAFAIALNTWRSRPDVPAERNDPDHYELSSDYPLPATEASSSHSSRHTKRVLLHGTKNIFLAFRSGFALFSAFVGVHFAPLREDVHDLARERQFERRRTHYTEAHPKVIRSLIKRTIAAPEHLPVYISVFERSQDPHIEPQDWRLIINILNDLQFDAGALPQAGVRGILYVLGGMYEGPLVELSVAKTLCSRFGEGSVDPIDAVLRHLMLGRIFDRERLIHLWHWDQACAKIRALKASEENVNKLIWVPNLIAKYPTLPYVQRQYDRDPLMRQCLQLLRGLLIFAGMVPMSTPSRPELLTSIYSATIFVGNAFLNGVWPQSNALSVVHNTETRGSISHPMANLLYVAHSRVKDPSGCFLCTLFIPCLLLNRSHPSFWSGQIWPIDIIKSPGVTDRFGFIGWTSGLEGLWEIYEADPSRLLGCMAYLVGNCSREQTMVAQVNIFLRAYDAYTQEDHLRMDLPTLNFLQNALEHILKSTTQEINEILEYLQPGLNNPWLLLHIETTCGLKTSLTTQTLRSMSWFGSPALEHIANRRIALYKLKVVPPEVGLLRLFCQTSSFTTHFNLLCVYTKPLPLQGRPGNPNGFARNAILYLLEQLDVVVDATFNTDRTGSVGLLDYLILVEQLRPRWMVLPRPWRSTFATLFTRKGEALAWMIEIANCLGVELRERGLEVRIPQQIPSPQPNDPFIPDEAHSLYVRFHIPVRQEGAASPIVTPLSGGTVAVSHERQIGSRYLNAAAALLPFISQMLKEVKSSPPDELHPLYASLLSLPESFGDRTSRSRITDYMEGIFERVQMEFGQGEATPTISRQEGEHMTPSASKRKRRGGVQKIRESHSAGIA